MTLYHHLLIIQNAFLACSPRLNFLDFDINCNNKRIAGSVSPIQMQHTAVIKDFPIKALHKMP